MPALAAKGRHCARYSRCSSPAIGWLTRPRSMVDPCSCHLSRHESWSWSLPRAIGGIRMGKVVTPLTSTRASPCQRLSGRPPSLTSTSSSPSRSPELRMVSVTTIGQGAFGRGSRMGVCRLAERPSTMGSSPSASPPQAGGRAAAAANASAVSQAARQLMAGCPAAVNGARTTTRRAPPGGRGWRAAPSSRARCGCGRPRPPAPP